MVSADCGASQWPLGVGHVRGPVLGRPAHRWQTRL